VKFGRLVFELCEQADRHADTLLAVLHTPVVGGAK